MNDTKLDQLAGDLAHTMQKATIRRRHEKYSRGILVAYSTETGEILAASTSFSADNLRTLGDAKTFTLWEKQFGSADRTSNYVIDFEGEVDVKVLLAIWAVLDRFVRLRDE